MSCLDILNKSCNDIIDINNSKTEYLNEKSVQMKIAFDLWKTLGIEPKLENCFDYEAENKLYTDIFLKDVSVKIGIEIKFNTKKTGGLNYINQGAQTNGKLNCLRDIERLLELKKDRKINIGYFIFLTNDYLYWKKGNKTKSKYNSYKFSLEDSKEIIKFKEQPNWPSRTHNDKINLSEIKTKKISWIGKDYGKNKCSFRFFIIEI